MLIKRNLDQILNSDKTLNLALIKVKSNVNSDKIINEINDKIPSVNALKTTKLAKNEADLISELFDPIINAIVLIVLIVSTAFICLTIYNATLEKIGEFTIIKAIGSTKFQLFVIVFTQSFLISLLGTILGFLLFLAAAYGVNNFMPDITMLVSVKKLLKYVGIVPLLSMAASYIPVRRIFKIDEAEVLRS